MQGLDHLTLQGAVGAGMGKQPGWESSLDGYAVSELLQAQVQTRGREGGEESMEAWLGLQDR